jgi:hypothetical protein
MDDITGSQQIGERIHKALRQACESKATFMVWHLLNIPDPNIQGFWSRYLHRVFPRIENLDNLDMRAIVLRKTAAEFTALQHGEVALQTALSMIPDLEWVILAAHAELPHVVAVDGCWDMGAVYA